MSSYYYITEANRPGVSKAVILHELLHAYGLRHQSKTNYNIMHPNKFLEYFMDDITNNALNEKYHWD